MSTKLEQIEARVVAASKAHGITYDSRRDTLRDPPDLETFDKHSVADVAWLIAKVRDLRTALTDAHNRLEQVFLRTGSTAEYASAATEKYRLALTED